MSTRKPPPTQRVRPPTLPYWPANAMSVREAAKKWNVSPWMVRVWVQQGRVNAAYGASDGNLWLAILQQERPPRLIPQTKYVLSGAPPATEAPLRPIADLTPAGPVVRSDAPRRPPTVGPNIDMDLEGSAPVRARAPAEAFEPAQAPASEGAPVSESAPTGKKRGGARAGAGRPVSTRAGAARAKAREMALALEAQEREEAQRRASGGLLLSVDPLDLGD